MARAELMMDLLERARVYDVRRRQSEMRHFRSYLDPFMLPDKEFVDTYRLNKDTVSSLIGDLRPFVPYTSRSTSLTVETKVFVALAFYASGSYQRGVGQNAKHSIAQPTVSLCIRQVTQAFNTAYIRNKYIKFPQTQEDRNNLKQRFNEKFNIPGIIGCIDGTHVAIIRPSEYEERYFNRKHYHSINAQIICDADLNILSIDSSHGGASHDSFIWENHPIRHHMESLFQNNEIVWLLGDSGYSVRKWLMTPITNAAPESPEAHYTSLHLTARNTVERAIGVLKARWRCLLAHRVLHYDPFMAGSIINACAVLHNIANTARMTVPELSPHDRHEETSLQIEQTRTMGNRNTALLEGREYRARLVARLWEAATQNN